MRIYFPRIIAWLSLLVLAVGCAALLASCAHPNQAPPPQSEPIGADALTPSDSLVHLRRQVDSVVVVPHRSLLDKVFGRSEASRVQRSEASRIGKKSTVSIYYGPATVTTTTVGKKATAATAEGASVVVAGKKSTAVAADSGAKVNIAASKQGPAAAGEGIEQHQTTEKKTLWATLLPGLGLLAGIGTVYWLAAGGGAMWLAALWRKNKPNPNQA